MGFSEEDKQFITQLITEQTAELTRRLAESDAKVSDLGRQLAESRSEVRSLKRQVEDSNIYIDDLEQYGRRMRTFRLVGVKLKMICSRKFIPSLPK